MNSLYICRSGNAINHMYFSPHAITVRGKILEWEKIGKFGELWALRQYFTRQLFLFRIFQLG